MANTKKVAKTRGAKQQTIFELIKETRKYAKRERRKILKKHAKLMKAKRRGR